MSDVCFPPVIMVLVMDIWLTSVFELIIILVSGTGRFWSCSLVTVNSSLPILQKRYFCFVREIAFPNDPLICRLTHGASWNQHLFNHPCFGRLFGPLEGVVPH